jgi:hypothetical protein
MYAAVPSCLAMLLGYTIVPTIVFIPNRGSGPLSFLFLMGFISVFSIFFVFDLAGFQRNFDGNQKGKDMAGSQNVHESLI